MTMYFRRKWELEPNDPRRWVPPPYEELREFWDRGLIMCSAAECFLGNRKIDDEAQYTPSLHQQQHNYGRWLPRHIRDGLPPSKSVAERPCRAEGFDTNVSHAHLSTHSDALSCSSCGVTHWRRNCPMLHRHNQSNDAGTDYSSCQSKE